MTPPQDPLRTALIDTLRIVYGDDEGRNTPPLGDHEYGADAVLALLDARGIALAALRAARGEPEPAQHTPGESHHYEIECRVCGQLGVVQLSVEPQRAAGQS